VAATITVPAGPKAAPRGDVHEDTTTTTADADTREAGDV
jgi:hypothetical protein